MSGLNGVTYICGIPSSSSMSQLMKNHFIHHWIQINWTQSHLVFAHGFRSSVPELSFWPGLVHALVLLGFHPVNEPWAELNYGWLRVVGSISCPGDCGLCAAAGTLCWFQRVIVSRVCILTVNLLFKIEERNGSMYLFACTCWTWLSQNASDHSRKSDCPMSALTSKTIRNIHTISSSPVVVSFCWLCPARPLYVSVVVRLMS